VKLPVTANQALILTVGLLVNGEYETLERMTQGLRIPAEAMARAINQYGRTLKMPPPEAYADLAHVYEREREGRRVYFVEFPLWTLEEGESDLELALALVEAGDGLYGVEINDIRVF
jgi:hypothetical protein